MPFQKGNKLGGRNSIIIQAKRIITRIPIKM